MGTTQGFLPTVAVEEEGVADSIKKTLTRYAVIGCQPSHL